MITKLYATTAMVAALALAPAGFAQQSQSNEVGGGNVSAAEAAGVPQPIFSNTGSDTGEGARPEGGFFAGSDGLSLASSLIGQSVYNLNGVDMIGQVTDLALGAEGQVLALVVEVAASDGAGKEIAVDFSEITWMQLQPGEQRTLAMNAAAGRLEAAPAFDRTALRSDQATRSAVANSASGSAVHATAEDVPEEGEEDLAERDGVRELEADPQTMDGFAETESDQPRQIVGASQVTEGGEDGAAPRAPITAESLTGMTVFGAEGEEIGDVEDVLVGEDGAINAMVIDVGGFLGLGAHRVAVDFAAAEFIEANGMRAVQVMFTEDQLRNQQPYDEEAYRQGAEGAVLGR